VADARQSSLGLSVPISEVLDPDLWLQRYAWPIIDSMKALWIASQAKTAFEAIPKDVIRWHLRSALSELELQIGVPMGIRVVKGEPVDSGLVQGRDYDQVRPRLPFMTSEARRSWNKVDLPAGVISVQRVRAFFFNSLIWSISAADDNEEFIHLQWPEQGTLRLTPTNSVGLVLNADALLSLYQTLAGYGRVVPNVWSVDYTMGPTDQLGQPGMIETVLADWVGAKAGILLLNQAGVAQTKGLSSTSIGFDGFSRSVSLQASAMYGINSCLEKVYQDKLNGLDIKRIRLLKRGIQVRAYGN
jgi:hypothetical protein